MHALTGRRPPVPSHHKIIACLSSKQTAARSTQKQTSGGVLHKPLTSHEFGLKKNIITVRSAPPPSPLLVLPAAHSLRAFFMCGPALRCWYSPPYHTRWTTTAGGEVRPLYGKTSVLCAAVPVRALDEINAISVSQLTRISSPSERPSRW